MITRSNSIPAEASLSSAKMSELKQAVQQLSDSHRGDDSKAAASDDELRKTFQDFVGQTFFGEMIKSLRSTQQEAAYMNGGRAEKIFQGQLDQTLAEELSNSSADKISDPMYDLFTAGRQ
ncbi:MAG TPA: hypothetical protein DDW52_05445 [Planctomycetaceae bacterium]|nr:hypothetical protein [Planctomycetaceae bacterium]